VSGSTLALLSDDSDSEKDLTIRTSPIVCPLALPVVGRGKSLVLICDFISVVVPKSVFSLALDASEAKPTDETELKLF